MRQEAKRQALFFPPSPPPSSLCYTHHSTKQRMRRTIRMESYANEMPTFGDLTNVSVEKLEELNAVLATILALPIARDTYAQIIDGKPTRTPYSEENKSFQSGTEELSSVSGNSKPTDRAYKEYEKIRKAFEPQNLIIDLKVRISSQSAPLIRLNLE